MKENSLIVAEKLDVTVLFSPDGLEKILSEIEQKAMSLVPDVKTSSGRDEIKSMAHRVARSKTLIDDVGKNLVAGWKEKSKRVDGLRKRARDFLDEVKDRVRKPLTDWELEQATIEAEKQQAAQKQILGRVNELASVDCILSYFDVSSLSDPEYEKLFSEKKEFFEAKQARIAEAKRIEAECLEKERLEQAAIREKLAADMAEVARIKAEQDAERTRLKAEQDKLDAEKRKVEDAARKEQERKDREAWEKQAHERAIAAAEKARKDWAEQEAKDKAEAEAKAKAEAERQESLRPDKEKLIAFANAIFKVKNDSIPSLTFGSPAVQILARAEIGIDKIVKALLKEAKEL